MDDKIFLLTLVIISDFFKMKPGQFIIREIGSQDLAFAGFWLEDPDRI